MELSEKKCKPCEGGIPALSASEIKELKSHINSGWKVSENSRLTKEYLFVNFRHTIDFVNKVANLAEEEGHHPVMHVYYARVEIELWTHAINGLSENDFILAYKIDKIQ
jgi:4a-hydroxytetrahydrobiopterin dehydratase